MHRRVTETQSKECGLGRVCVVWYSFSDVHQDNARNWDVLVCGFARRHGPGSGTKNRDGGGLEVSLSAHNCGRRLDGSAWRKQYPEDGRRCDSDARWFLWGVQPEQIAGECHPEREECGF